MALVWQFFTRHAALAYLLMIALVVGGAYSLVMIQKESAPEIQVPVAVVSTSLPGASAGDVESLVTNEIEQAVQNLENVEEITSTSRTGVSSITVEFDASADIERSIQDVKDAVDLAVPDLPEDASDPVVSDVNFADQPILVASVSSEAPTPLFKDLVEELQREIEGVAGVNRADVAGVADREVTVLVEPTTLSGYGLSLSDVTGALRAYNTALPVGEIEVGGVAYAVSLEGDLESPEDVGSVPVATPDGGFVYVRDLGLVAPGLAEPSSLARVSVGGEPAAQAATLFVFKQRGADITTVADDVNELLANLGDTLLEDSQVAVSFDAGQDIQNDLINLSTSGLQTVALVLLVLIIFLGWREALIAALAIPLSFFVAFIGLYVFGNTINFISLFSLILSIGILVDSAIVMTEGIHTNMKNAAKTGGDKVEAALTAIRDFHFPLTSGTLTTVAVFVPLFTVSGITGEFIATIPFTVIFVLLASLIVALAFIPLIASTFLHRRSSGRFEDRQEEVSANLRRWYQRQMRRLYGHRRRENAFLVTVLLAFVLTLTFPVIGLVKVTFFPAGDFDLLFVEVELPQGSTLTDTDLAVRAVEEELYGRPYIESFTSRVGGGSAFSQGMTSGERFGAIDVNLVELNERDRTSQEIIAELEEDLRAFTQYEVTVGQPEQGPPTGSPVVITFLGEDLDELNRLAAESTDLLTSIPGTRNVRNSAQDDSAEFVLTVDRGKAAALGVTPAAIAGELRTAVFGTEATTIRGLEEDIEVVVTLNLNPDRRGAHDTNETTVDRLNELSLPTPQGEVLLGNVIDISFAQAQERIRHEDLERIATVSSDLTPGAFATDVTSAFQERAEAELDIPAGVTLSVGGETEEVDQSFQDMFRALGMGLVLILVMLVIQFNSYKQAGFILAVVPLSLIGVLTGLALSGQPLSFPAMLGYIALSGIVVNNAIILIDVINGLRRERTDASIDDVILEGATARLRPILLTTITTVVGISPLIWVSELWRPIAFSIIFGLTFAVVLTLILVPIMYRRFHERSALLAFLRLLWRALSFPVRVPYRLLRRRTGVMR
ncbi:hypothetical protein GVX82_02670 [Patescibacteria group bacterium]|jgi:HAE1 family hydrophobic/amphiphilic exporter-1|nr:hypothetical protein [Patescibacteria group bacterium]